MKKYLITYVDNGKDMYIWLDNIEDVEQFIFDAVYIKPYYNIKVFKMDNCIEIDTDSLIK